MTHWLKQSTASQEIPLGYFLDSTDGNTEETALTIANTDIKLWKTGATTLANKNSGGATHISNGIYYAVLDATDTNTLGPMTIFVHVSGALATKVDTIVLPANAYDSLVAGTDVLDVSVTQWLGTAAATPTVAGVPEIDITHVDGQALTGGTGPIPSLGIIERGTAQSATSTTLVGRAAATDDTIKAGNILWAYGSTQGYWQSVMIVSVSADTFTIAAWPTATPSGTITYLVFGTPTVPSTLPISANVTQISGDATAADNAESFFDGTGYAGTNNVIPTVTSVTAVATGGITAGSIATDAIGAAEIAADAIAEIQSGLSTLTAAGVRSALGMASANLDTQIAAVQSDTNDIQTRLPAALVSGRMDASVGAMASSVLTAAATATDFGAEIADAVCDEALAGHATAGTVGAALSAASSAGDPWGTLLPGAYGAGTAGKIIGDNVNATVSSRASQTSVDTVDTVADAIKLKTDQLNFTVAGEVDANAVSMNNTTINGTGTSGDKWRGS